MALLWRCEVEKIGRGTVTVRALDGAGGIQIVELVICCAIMDGEPAASVAGTVEPMIQSGVPTSAEFVAQELN